MIAVIKTETFGERLKACRLALCKQQNILSSMSGIPQSTLSDIEADKFVPSDDKIKDLADSLRVKTDWLISGSGLPFQEEGIESFAECRKPQSENAAIAIMLSLETIDDIPVYFDQTDRFFVFGINSKQFYIVFTSISTSPRRRADIVMALEAAKYKFYFSKKIKKSPIGKKYEQGKNKYRYAFLQYWYRQFQHTYTMHASMRKFKEEKEKEPLLNEIRNMLPNPAFENKLRALINKFEKDK